MTDLAGNKSGSIALVVAVSVLVGLIGSAALTLVVFSGAREHVITASALLAFAVGWALLAALSTRFTQHPQRWAMIPAGTMAGLAVLIPVLARSNGAMEALGWVWPPVLLGLAAWTAACVRRELRSRSRWLVYAVVAFLAVVSVGGALETIVERIDRSNYAMPGKLIDIGGRKMHIHCTGSGSPTVVLQPGMAETGAAMAWISPAVAKTTRVCVYDRAGRGWSESSPDTQDGTHIAADLHALLKGAHVPGPYVLAGHSFGGLYVLAYAARYPDEVAAMVLIDSTPPDAFEQLPDYPSFYAGYRRVVALGPTLARFGVGRLIAGTSYTDLPASVRGERRATASTGRAARSTRDEFIAAPKSMEQAKALRTLGDKPLIVLTASDGNQKGWGPTHARLAKLSTNSVQREVPNSEHASLIEEQKDAAAVTQAIADVVHAARDAGPADQAMEVG